MRTLKNILLCVSALFSAMNGMIISDYSRNNEVADCIERIVETTESIVDLTVVNFKEINELTFLRRKEMTFISRSFLWVDNLWPNRFYVCKCDNYKELQRGIHQLRNDFFWNPRGKFIMIIENTKGHIPMISSILIKHNIFNVIVVTWNRSGYEIYAFNPELDPCGKPAITTLELINQCSKIKKTDKLFRYKIPSKFRGCKFKVVSHNFWPFSSFNNTLGPGISLHRLEMWAESEGIYIELIKNEIDEDFGTVLDNFTFTGMIGLVEAGKVNAAVGGFSIFYPRARALDFSYPYSLDYNRAIVARAPFMSHWRAVLRQFSFYVTIVIYLFIAYFCFAVAHHSIFEKKKRDIIRDLLIVFGYICSNISVDRRKMKTKSALRLIVCCLLIFVFFISFLIQAYLLSVTTHPLREHQIKHLNEALSKCKPVKSSMWLSTYRSKDPPDCLSVMGCFKQLLERRNEKLYTLVSDTSYKTAAWNFLDAEGEPEVVKTVEPLLQLLRTMFFERGSPLLFNYNKLSQRSRHSGLSAKISRDFFHRIRLKQAKQRRKVEPPEFLHQFKDVFLVLLVGYSLATITVIYECKSYFYAVQ